MLKVKKIVGRLLSSNMYLLYKDDVANCWLIDIGDFSVLAEDILNGLNVRGVFITHSHFDHMAGINDLCRMFPDCKVYTSECGKDVLYSSKMNFSLYYERPVEYEGTNIEILHNHDKIQLYEDIVLHVVETPGHCSSCLTYYTDEYVFSGDSFIPDTPVVTKLPRGNHKEAVRSLACITELAKTRTVFAGHDKDGWVGLFQ